MSIITYNSLINQVITFNKGAEDLECYPEDGMCARVMRVTPDSDGVIKLDLDYSEFDEVNKAFESSNYYDDLGVACLNARQAGLYKAEDHIYIMEDDPIGKYFEVVGNIDVPPSWSIPKSLTAIDYLQKILACAELNQDDLEPETRKIVQEAGCWLADEIETDGEGV